ncbi:hypothetical protein I7I50_02295 [Histoplasma capsulatum G186AR]|uniref:Uncharacterized protein n=1 Tax=Ajellomyces capsulatus TaxID=5037 RepID=A0A8H8D5Z1_AJECA|nr:hypothetical protein I7I52_01041 [Histoplasma capsulatum]QSS71458.1 hypothetical protein I7I50_02295 [Histoplasma capsulatum G186AR]
MSPPALMCSLVFGYVLFSELVFPFLSLINVSLLRLLQGMKQRYSHPLHMTNERRYLNRLGI